MSAQHKMMCAFTVTIWVMAGYPTAAGVLSHTSVNLSEDRRKGVSSGAVADRD